MNVVELAPGMCPARHFINSAAFIEMMKAGVGIGLQSAFEVLQMLPGMLALAIRRVGEPNGWSGVFTGRSFIAHISPEAASPGLSVTRSEYRNRRIIGMNLRRRQDMLA